MAETNIVVVRTQQGQPHRGKVFAAVQAHLSDVPRYAAGLCSKLISEGYTGYLVRTTNDEKSGEQTIAENILSNEQEQVKMASLLGFKDVFDLYYRSHFMDDIAPVELQSRLVLIFRMLKADTVISFSPTAKDDDKDHAATAYAVQEASLMAGLDRDFQEHFEAGFQPHAVVERYWFYTGAGQPFNRVVDIGPYLDKKVDAIAACKSQGGNQGSVLRARLSREGKRLPLLGSDDAAANRAYVRQFLLDDNREFGKPYKLDYAERFYYTNERQKGGSKVEDYIAKNAVRG